jgi:hypothetical protein
MPESVGPSLPPEDDHDLLTFRLASDRLLQAVSEERGRLSILEGQPAADPAQLLACRQRLAALGEALARHQGFGASNERGVGFYRDGGPSE